MSAARKGANLSPQNTAFVLAQVNGARQLRVCPAMIFHQQVLRANPYCRRPPIRETASMLTRFSLPFRIAVVVGGLTISSLRAADFSITSPGFHYNVNGTEPNPTLFLVRGQTYTFDINTDPSHPVQISDANGFAYNDGVDNNNIFDGVITFTVPMSGPSTLAYLCSIHLFGGQINIVGGPPPADFAVTSPDFFYRINGQEPNPTLTLTRGSNYTFGINTAEDHPFQISSDFDGTPYSNGVSNNNISSGVIVFAVPTNAPATLYYVCSLHLFGGQINVVDPPPPPPPPDFSVSSPGSYYVINGEETPLLTLTRGVTYTFAIETDISHPFQIATDLGGTPYNDGVVNNNINSGTLTFTVPLDAPGLLFYICSVHLFGGMIDIVDPPEPPPIIILSIKVDTSNVVMQSLGTNGNGWLAIPEFSSNLVSSNWAIVPNYSNSFTSGTNTTTFNRLDPICGPNVFLRIKNVKN